jgi:DNA-binding LacI/PurR family transcriptional regulator
VSITKVSKAAGVSIATVSRVLNGSVNVSPEASRAVHEAVKRLGYNPPRDGAAGRPRRTPSGMKTGNIAVLFPDVHQEALRTTLSGRLLHGIEEVLRRRGLAMVVSGLSDAHSLPPCIERKQVDAVIVRGTGSAVDFGESMLKLPTVWIFEAGYRPSLAVDMIVEDNALIGTMAADWLLKRGHTRLGYLNPMPDHPSFRVRGIFFREAVENVPDAALTSVSTADTAAIAIDKLLSKSQRLTGLFVPGGDIQVVEIYRALSARGVRVGKDIDLITCVNDAQRLATLDPALPNIDIQAEAIGRAAVDSVLWRLRHHDEQPRRTVIAPILIEGTQSAPIPARPHPISPPR